jgi:hypothetical protein
LFRRKTKKKHCTYGIPSYDNDALAVTD